MRKGEGGKSLRSKSLLDALMDWRGDFGKTSAPLLLEFEGAIHERMDFWFVLSGCRLQDVPGRKSRGQHVDLSEVPAEQYPRIADHFGDECGRGFTKCEVALGSFSGERREADFDAGQHAPCPGSGGGGWMNLRVSALAGTRMFATLDGYSR